MMNDKQASMTQLLMTVGLAKVSTNAFEAQRYGFLRPTDTIIFNQERRVQIALQRAQYEADAHYMPAAERQYLALGKDFLSLAQGQLDAQRLGHYISKHDYDIALRIATVLSGGDLPRNTYIQQRYIQQLEKVHFLELIKTEKRMTESHICSKMENRYETNLNREDDWHERSLYRRLWPFCSR